MQNKKVYFQDIGLIDYQKAWDYQESLFKSLVDKKLVNRNADITQQVMIPNYLLVCEHPHVYTLGKSGKEEHLLLQEDALIEKNASYYKINRGGDITYHGPGQLVVYPILDLDNFFTDIHKYLRFLEEAVIQTLTELGIESGRIEGLTGVWIDFQSLHPRKICAMGVRSSRWVVMHGLALNVHPDMSYFGNIVPCGITDKEVTSIEKELGTTISIDKVKDLLVKKIAELFEMELIFGLSTSTS